MNITKHAEQRLQQRGLIHSDLDMIIRHGTETKDGYILRRTDVQAIERDLKKLIERFYRLEGKHVVVEREHVITAYHPSKEKERKVLRSIKH
jgi:hypothetical protein